MAVTPEFLLRSLLGETIPEGSADIDTFFTNTQVSDLLDRHFDNLNAAAAEGWLRKAADVAKLIDISESGSERSLSQKYKHYLSMAKHFADAAGTDLVAAGAGRRVIGRPINLDESDSEQYELPFGPSSENIRIYPLKRFRAVLQ